MFSTIQAKVNRKILQFKLLGIVLKNNLLKERKQLEKPSVWFDLSVDYERYIYTLCKFFELEGYQVYIKADLRYLVKLTDQFSKWMITEGEIIFSNKRPEKPVAAFSDRRSRPGDTKVISKDYFTTIFRKDVNSYHVPIGMHPFLYQSGLWNAKLTPVRRKQSVLFAGSFKGVYEEMTQHQKFRMPNRLELKNMLQSLPNTTFPKSYDELVQNSKDGQIDVVARSTFKVPQEKLRQTISGYAFFIACPGFIMPQAHNVYEALSAGAIPIIHRQYAQMFDPELEDNKTAIIYEDNFTERIRQALGISPEQIQFMLTQVDRYYNKHLTPKAIIKRMIDPEKTTYFLNAEKNSVLLMK
jgi:hypothetical protein